MVAIPAVSAKPAVGVKVAIPAVRAKPAILAVEIVPVAKPDTIRPLSMNTSLSNSTSPLNRA